MEMGQLLRQDLRTSGLEISGDITTIDKINLNSYTPSKFNKKVVGFIRRNSFKLDEKSKKRVICIRCLKAYIYSIIKKYNFPLWIPSLYFGNLKCQAGHSGNYYLDNGAVKRI